MSSYLAAATLNMANLVVKSLDQQLRGSTAKKYQGDTDRLSGGRPVASVHVSDVKTGCGYGALEYQIVLGTPNQVLKELTFNGENFSYIRVLDFSSAYEIRFMPQISLAFPPTYSGEQIREVMTDGNISDKFIQPGEVSEPTLAEVAKYLNVCLSAGVVMQPGYEFGPVRVMVNGEVGDGDRKRSRTRTELFELSPGGFSKLEAVCERSWAQSAAG